MSCTLAIIGRSDQCPGWERGDAASTADATTWLSVNKAAFRRSSAAASTKKEGVSFSLQGFQDLLSRYLKKREAWEMLLAGWVMMRTPIPVWLPATRFWESTEASQKILGPSWICRVAKWEASTTVGDVGPVWQSSQSWFSAESSRSSAKHYFKEK